MKNLSHTTMLVLSWGELTAPARSALDACAVPLGHEGSMAFEDISSLDAAQLVLLIHEHDPWSVVAVDEGSIGALSAAFADETSGFAPDAPAEVRGYLFVAVPGFDECLENQGAKRIAWARLKAAAHPAAPY